MRTVSGSIFSAPVEANLTIAPLPPSEFTFGDNFRYTDNNTKYDWDPTPNSEQYQFKVGYCKHTSCDPLNLYLYLQLER